jgi:hypothetical protein
MHGLKSIFARLVHDLFGVARFMPSKDAKPMNQFHPKCLYQAEHLQHIHFSSQCLLYLRKAPGLKKTRITDAMQHNHRKKLV